MLWLLLHKCYVVMDNFLRLGYLAGYKIAMWYLTRVGALSVGSLLVRARLASLHNERSQYGTSLGYWSILLMLIHNMRHNSAVGLLSVGSKLALVVSHSRGCMTGILHKTVGSSLSSVIALSGCGLHCRPSWSRPCFPQSLW